MKDLNYIECLEINGGSTAPQVSDNVYVQSGYTVGWHIGHAIGNTVEMFGDTLDALGGWLFD